MSLVFYFISKTTKMNQRAIEAQIFRAKAAGLVGAGCKEPGLWVTSITNGSRPNKNIRNTKWAQTKNNQRQLRTDLSFVIET